MTALLSSHSNNARDRQGRSALIRDQLTAEIRSGRPARAEQFEAAMHDAGGSYEDWHDLILTEITTRREIGDDLTESQYVERFPGHADWLRRLFGEETVTCKVVAAGPSTFVRSAPSNRVKIPGYEILEVLGRGGMGVVYKARHIKLNRVVALKMVLAGRNASEEDLKRFWLEAEAVASLSHPNIVQVYEFGEHDGCPFFSLEYVEGGTLADRLRAGGVSFVEAARLAKFVAAGAHAAHAHGIIHRDLKPANILLGPDRDAQKSEMSKPQPAIRAVPADYSPPTMPKLTDFGIAKKLNDSRVVTATGMAAGTPQYMAPEQALASKARPVGPAADVYSIGAILYEMICERPPFDGDNPVEIMNRAVTEQPPAPSRFNSSVPRDLETICLKCLEKEPHRRYSSAAALGDDLDRWLEGKPISARPISSLGQAWRWCVRNPAVASLLAGIIFALFAGASVAAILAIQARGFAHDAERNAEEARENLGEAERQKFDAQQNAVQARTNETAAKLARNEEAKLRNEADERERRRARELYASGMSLGLAEWEGGHVSTLYRTLEKFRPTKPNDPDPRGFEWHYLYGLLTPYECRWPTPERLGSASPIPGTDFWAVCGIKSVFIWNAQIRQYATIPLPYQEEFRQAVLDRSGTLMALSCAGPVVHIHDTKAKKNLRTLALDPKVGDFAAGMHFTPDGKQLVVALGRNANALISGAVVVFDVKTGDVVRHMEGVSFAAERSALSEDGKVVALCASCGEFRIWDVATGKLKRHIVHPEYANCVALSPDGSVVAAGTTTGLIELREVATGKLTHTLKGHSDTLCRLDWSRDGRRLASGSNEGSVRIWDPATGEETHRLRSHETSIVGLAFSTDGDRLVTAAEGMDAISWNLRRESTAKKRMLGAVAVACLRHPDSNRMVIVRTDGSVVNLDLQTASVSGAIRFSGLPADVVDADLGPDGKTLVLATRDKGIVTVSLERPETPARRIAEAANPTCVASSKDGKWLAWGTENGAIFVKSTAGDSAPLQIRDVPQWIRSIAFDPADPRRLAAVSFDGSLRVWNHTTGESIFRIELRAHAPTHVVFSPDGKSIATAGKNDRTARLFDSHTGEQLQEFVGHSRGLQSVQFSSDGKRLATSSDDLTVKIWDVGIGMPTITLKGVLRPARRVQFDSDGAAVLAIYSHMVYVWDGRSSFEHEKRRNASAPLKSK